MDDRTTALRALPQVDVLSRELAESAPVGERVATWIVRREIARARDRIMTGGQAGDVRAAAFAAASTLKHASVRRVINATGVILHTNLGRAPLSDDAREAVERATGAASLEFDVVEGARGMRAPVAGMLAAALVDAEDAMIVNNNAAALLLALAAIAHGHEVIVSRGELIEIGGEFRLPDVMEASGAVLREVGTTNRTHERDYKAALSDRTGMILKVHPSNYRVVGFTKQPSLSDLVTIARAGEVPLVYDIGSGLLGPDDVMPDEPDARTAIATGCSLVCFSGDKLLGGPQAGVLAGSAELIERCRRHPIARAVRADKLTLAAMEATLWAHARGEQTPVQLMLGADLGMLEQRAKLLCESARGAVVAQGESVVGGGAVPGQQIPTPVVRIAHEHPERLAAALRANDPPVIARIERGAVIIDPRTIAPNDDPIVASALRALRS